MGLGQVGGQVVPLQAVAVDGGLRTFACSQNAVGCEMSSGHVIMEHRWNIFEGCALGQECRTSVHVEIEDDGTAPLMAERPTVMFRGWIDYAGPGGGATGLRGDSCHPRGWRALTRGADA